MNEVLQCTKESLFYSKLPWLHFSGKLVMEVEVGIKYILLYKYVML